jgi:hypothetical protein
LHFTYLRKTSAFKNLVYHARRTVPFLHGIINVLKRRRPFREPLVQFNEYDLQSLFAILHDTGCHDVHVRFSLHAVPRAAPRLRVYGVMLFFRKVALPMW